MNPQELRQQVQALEDSVQSMRSWVQIKQSVLDAYAWKIEDLRSQLRKRKWSRGSASTLKEELHHAQIRYSSLEESLLAEQQVLAEQQKILEEYYQTKTLPKTNVVLANTRFRPDTNPPPSLPDQVEETESISPRKPKATSLPSFSALEHLFDLDRDSEHAATARDLHHLVNHSSADYWAENPPVLPLESVAPMTESVQIDTPPTPATEVPLSDTVVPIEENSEPILPDQPVEDEAEAFLEEFSIMAETDEDPEDKANVTQPDLRLTVLGLPSTYDTYDHTEDGVQTSEQDTNPHLGVDSEATTFSPLNQVDDMPAAESPHLGVDSEAMTFSPVNRVDDAPAANLLLELPLDPTPPPNISFWDREEVEATAVPTATPISTPISTPIPALNSASSELELSQLELSEVILPEFDLPGFDLPELNTQNPEFNTQNFELPEPHPAPVEVESSQQEAAEPENSNSEPVEMSNLPESLPPEENESDSASPPTAPPTGEVPTLLLEDFPKRKAAQSADLCANKLLETQDQLNQLEQEVRKLSAWIAQQQEELASFAWTITDLRDRLKVESLSLRSTTSIRQELDYVLQQYNALELSIHLQRQKLAQVTRHLDDLYEKAARLQRLQRLEAEIIETSIWIQQQKEELDACSWTIQDLRERLKRNMGNSRATSSIRQELDYALDQYASLENSVFQQQQKLAEQQHQLDEYYTESPPL